MLQLEHVTVRFGEKVAVDGVDLEIADGETVAVLGPSGSGKSTLLRAIAGLQPIDDGRVRWDGTDLAGVPAHQRRFGLMFQEYVLFPHRDVAGNVEFGLRMAGVSRHIRARRVDDVLELVGLRELRERRVASLSGGEQQRVALARALAVSPRLLMLDEPLGALDRAWRERLLGEIRALLDRAQLAGLYVTHDHDEAFTVAARVAVMRAGRVVQAGEPAEVWRRPVDAWTASFFGFGPAAPAEVRAGEAITPFGALPVPDSRVSGPALLMFRPDALHIAAHGPVEGKVVRTTFAGEHVEVIVDARGHLLRVHVAARELPPAGARVRLDVDTDGLLVYPPD